MVNDTSFRPTISAWSDFTRTFINYIKPNVRVVTLSPFSLRLADKFVTLLDALHLNPGARRPSLMNIDKPCSYEKIKREMGWEPTFSLEQSIADSAAAVSA